MKEISSHQNIQFKYWKNLLRSKGLRESKHLLFSGNKLVGEVLNSRSWNDKIESILTDQNFDINQYLQSLFFSNQKEDIFNKKLQKEELIEFEELKSKIVKLSSSLYKELDVLGTKGPILVLEQPEILNWNIDEDVNGIEILCPLGDPQNLGALIRTAYAYNLSSVVLLKEAAHPFLPKSIKSSSGSVLKMKLFWGPSIQGIQANEFHQSNIQSPQRARESLETNQKKAVPLFAIDLRGDGINSKSWPVDSMRLLIGEEGKGVPETFSGERIRLPMLNPMESLNAAVAAGIVIYQLQINK